MFHFFLLSVVLFFALFFSLAAKYVKQFEQEHMPHEASLQWTNAVHQRV